MAKAQQKQTKPRQNRAQRRRALSERSAPMFPSSVETADASLESVPPSSAQPTESVRELAYRLYLERVADPDRAGSAQGDWLAAERELERRAGTLSMCA